MPVSERSGVWITLEGGDGSGKTTQAELLEKWLTDAGECGEEVDAGE